ncbi:hypothetical protein [Thermococcus thioreducens]|uniref:Uncharacterized protein n=1 Tax=Thermococcus thioreducens TaxID=277988 RepID=A0A1I0N211_9EURY|nr:hypothetical protein [Thermococcus thioreducens]ASJ12194.1 hypothetical protein A3L14_04525 [Thermococcus thioreducens]SEV95120.1 hypothetical protein SAMN05216170_1062 [Thermococcus thioreducens]
MKIKSYEVELPHSWDSLQVVISEPEKTLPFFPYFESLHGDTVRFKVPRFIFDFGYEFKLALGFMKNGAVYTFTGEKGVLTVTFEMQGKGLKVTASWSGFGELLMGKPLEIFARGIAEAIRDFCSAQATCPVLELESEEGVVHHVSPESAPALIKRIVWELRGEDFVLEGISEKGVKLSATVRNGRLVRLTVRDPLNKETVVEADLPVLEVTPELFEGLPLDGAFKIKVRKI